MKDVILSIPDKEYPFFMKLVQSLDFVKVKEPKEKASSKAEFLKGLEEAVQEVNDIKAGKRKGSTLKDFLDEL